MKPFTTTLLGFVLGAASLAAQASDPVLSSRSAGKLAQQQDVDLAQRVKQAEIVSRQVTGLGEDYASSPAAAGNAGLANRHDQLFEIYDADVQLVADLDGDGYHHAIGVYFDADVNHHDATVYAKLYLSREGGPWYQYFTTDLFHLVGDESYDAYEVETELLEGYSPGYYAVLIELYSLDHAYMVASEVLDYHYLGRDLTIEDLSWDEPQATYYSEVYYSHGAGSMAALLLFFLVVQVAIAARGVLAKSPPRKSEKYKNKRLP